MTCTKLILGLLLISVAGCGENACKPQDDTDEPPDRELGIKDLVLTVNLSADTIARGETLHIDLVATNPYGRPVDATFASTCLSWFWIHDEDGREFLPTWECRPTITPFHMDPYEERTFEMVWTACGDVSPGQHTVVAGFNTTMKQASHRADPIKISIVAKEENVTGLWVGTSRDNWGLPEWEGNRITLILEQVDNAVAGTFSAGGAEFRVERGLMQDNQVEFAITYESAGVVVEFSGDVCGNSIHGKRYVVDPMTRDILDDAYWYVHRVQ